MTEKYKIVYAVPPQGGARVAEIWEDERRLCALPGYIEKDDLNDEIEKLKKENGDLNDKVEELEGEIDKLKNGLEGE